MYSFATLSVFATLAFSAFTSASPIASPVAAVAPRDNGPASVPDILNTLVSGLKTPADKLSAIKTSDAATSAAITPLIGEVNVLLDTAITAVQALEGQSLDVILGSATLQSVAQLVAGILALVIPILTSILNLVGSDGGLDDLLSSVVTLLVTLVGDLLSLVPGLLDALVPLVSSLLATVTGLLGLGALSTLLGLAL